MTVLLKIGASVVVFLVAVAVPILFGLVPSMSKQMVFGLLVPALFAVWPRGKVLRSRYTAGFTGAMIGGIIGFLSIYTPYLAFQMTGSPSVAGVSVAATALLAIVIPVFIVRRMLLDRGPTIISN